MHQINSKYIFRHKDRCLLDPINFKIYKLNYSGYEIISKIEGEFDLQMFENICHNEGFFGPEVESFWKTCIENKLFIKLPPST